MDALPRFFVKKENIKGQTVTIDDDQVLHIHKSLRLKEGDEIIVFDGEGSKYLMGLTRVSKKIVEGEIKKELELNIGSHKITLIQGLPKAKKFDLIVKKVTEIGVSEIFPIETHYSMLRKKDIQKKHERYQKLIVESCKQSERDSLTKLNECITFDNLDEFKDYELKLICSNINSPEKLKTVLEESKNIKSICYLIGPEGGFSPSEMQIAKDNGFKEVIFGKNILRTETAAIYLASILDYFYNN